MDYSVGIVIWYLEEQREEITISCDCQFDKVSC